jgi:hypothetical protein
MHKSLLAAGKVSEILDIDMILETQTFPNIFLNHICSTSQIYYQEDTTL